MRGGGQLFFVSAHLSLIRFFYPEKPSTPVTTHLNHLFYNRLRVYSLHLKPYICDGFGVTPKKIREKRAAPFPDFDYCKGNLGAISSKLSCH